MRIRTKLLALIAVPILAISVAAAVGFGAQSRVIETAESSTETVARTNSVYDAIVAVGAERLAVAGANLDSTTSDIRSATDEALVSLGDAGFDDLAQELETDLSTARTAAAISAISQYTDINASLLEIPEGAASQYPDAPSRDNAIVNRLAVETLEERELAWLAYLDQNEANVETAASLAAEFATASSQLERTQQFANNAEIDAFLRTEPSTQLVQLETVALDDLNEQELSVSSDQALESLANFRAGWITIIDSGTSAIDANVDEQLTAANNLRSLFTLLAVIGVIVGLGLIFVIYRSITEPLSALLDRASQVANEDLPSLVTRLRDSENDGELPTAEEIPVTSNDEIGELVSAFNDVQVTAYDLATEQALGRRATGEMFVNLGRRNQRLLERILAKLTELQQEEEDPDALTSLFELDNIVTRMRRNAESLLVMAGASTPRQWRQSVDIDNTVRAAVGEVEGYQRINIEELASVDLRGSVVADVSHLLAELLENAVNFSDGGSEVSVTGQFERDSYVLNVIDNGIGMTGGELEANNSRIADPPPLDQLPTKFLGLYVVGRLADRHGIAVRLSGAPKGGVMARVELPVGLIATSADQPTSIAPIDIDAGAPTVASIDEPSGDEAEATHRGSEDSQAVTNLELAIEDEIEVEVEEAEVAGAEVEATEIQQTDADSPTASEEIDNKVAEKGETNAKQEAAKKDLLRKESAGKDNARQEGAAATAVPDAAPAGRPKLQKRPSKKTKRRKEDETATGPAPSLPVRQKGKALKSSEPPGGVDRRGKSGDDDGPADSESPEQQGATSAQGATDFSAMMSALSSGISKGIEDSSSKESASEDSASGESASAAEEGAGDKAYSKSDGSHES